MQYRDISTDSKTVYRLNADETVVFFMLNRSGNLTIELAGPGATAHIFALYSGKADVKQSLSLTQKHLAPDTVSSALVKAALDDHSSFTYNGAITIAPDAHRSDASQESRTLLLSSEARTEARPALEILAHDVKCRHATTTAPLNTESLYFARSRGLTEERAQRLFVSGFFNEVLERMEPFGVSIDQVKAHVVQQIS